MELQIDFSYWRLAPNVSAQPRLQLSDWRVITNHQGKQFLLGLLPGMGTLRITTTIHAVDPVTRVWRTQSGRYYETPGPPTRCDQLRKQMSLLARASGLAEWRGDDADTIWQAMQRAVQ
jgi:hypothetical protein